MRIIRMPAMMRKKLIALICMTAATLLHASEQVDLYQIDIIGFAHEQQASHQQESMQTASLWINNKNNISLQTDYTETTEPYHLRAASTSTLKREFNVLKQQPDYLVLFHYSWLQPGNNQRAVKLPKVENMGWQVEGSLRIRQSNYFLLDTDLYFTSDNHQSFVFNQKKRLKDDTLYYLDHPQAGVLVKIHKLS